MRHVAYGYTLMVNEKRERTVSSAWQTQAEALDALNTRLKEISEGRIERPKDASVSQLKTEYLA